MRTCLCRAGTCWHSRSASSTSCRPTRRTAWPCACAYVRVCVYALRARVRASVRDLPRAHTHTNKRLRARGRTGATTQQQQHSPQPPQQTNHANNTQRLQQTTANNNDNQQQQPPPTNVHTTTTTTAAAVTNNSTATRPRARSTWASSGWTPRCARSTSSTISSASLSRCPSST